MMIPRFVAAVAALALLVVACAGPAAEAPSGSQVVAELADYKITVNVPSVKAGSIKIGEITSIPAGKSAAVTVQLTPGKYVFMCNVAGHYQLGMHTGFTVEAP